MQSHKGVKITRYDLKTTFDEANYIIPHQVVTAFQEGKRAIKIISADTDVFVILCHFNKSMNMNAEVFLENFNNDKHMHNFYTKNCRKKYIYCVFPFVRTWPIRLQ